MNHRSLGSGPSGNNQTSPLPDGRVGRNRTCIGRVSDASPAVEGQPIGRPAGNRTLPGRLRGECSALELRTCVPLVAGPGIEPGAVAYEAAVLPIHHPAMEPPRGVEPRRRPYKGLLASGLEASKVKCGGRIFQFPPHIEIWLWVRDSNPDCPRLTAARSTN